MVKRFFRILCAGMFVFAAGAQVPPITSLSEMDWNTQLIHSIISLDAQKKGIQLPTGRNAALQMLEMETPALLKDTFFSIIVDSSERLGNTVESGRIKLSDLNRIIEEGKKTPPYFSRDLSLISLSHTISLTSIGSLFIAHQTPYQPKIPLETVPSRPYTGILIDARGSLGVHGEYTAKPLVPCLFPRIWNTSMDILYEKNMVSAAVAQKTGIVRYSASLDEMQYRDRIGTDPLRIVAREVFGINHTDPVVSDLDYLKIMSVSENRKLLAEGKIVIICDPERMQAAGPGPVKDDNYYFTAQEIERRLGPASVAHMDFSDAWEGLKLTIYDIRFVADTARILAEERQRLDLIADALKLAGSGARFSVEGHTASIGKPAGELNLSLERARTVATELAARGIPDAQIESAGFGGTRPVATNDTDEGRAKNRRVEITIRLD